MVQQLILRAKREVRPALDSSHYVRTIAYGQNEEYFQIFTTIAEKNGRVVYSLPQAFLRHLP